MKHEKLIRRGTLAADAVCGLGLWLCLALACVPACGQSLTGRWKADGRTLDNGEQEKSILELKQNGNDLTGTLKTLGFTVEVKGTATGNHFEFSVPEGEMKHPRLVGDLVNGELQATMRGRRKIVAKPATAADDL